MPSFFFLFIPTLRHLTYSFISFQQPYHVRTSYPPLFPLLCQVCVHTMASKPHPPLMKKHSQTDLISRLKSRKILGVGGEDDDGEVHRSKVRFHHVMFYLCVIFIQYQDNKPSQVAPVVNQRNSYQCKHTC